MAATCASCRNPAAKACAKCKTTLYCSRDCQKADWKVHKKICAKNASDHASGNTPPIQHSSSYTTPHLKDLEKHVAKPFTRLQQGSYLHDRPETDVFKLLIDSFRMRQNDDFTLEAKTTPGSIYAGASSSVEPFRRYLDLAATRAGLLPPWWSAEKKSECEAFGESGAWSDLRAKVAKQDLIDHYGDEKMPMQVRMLAEAVYGVGSMGQDGSAMRRAMAQMEGGGGPGNGGFMSMLNLAR